MNSKKAFLFFNFFFAFIIPVISQVSFSGDDLRSEFKRAMDLFSKEKYAAAIRIFDAYIENDNQNDAVSLSEAEYFAALSALRLFNPDSEYRMTSFMARHPESPRLNESRLALGDYFYQNKSYRKACPYYELVRRQELDNDKLPEYFFRYGYSLYVNGR